MKISLEQWLVFKTIVDEGSFAAAAEQLSKSQSTLSYAMTQMAAHLPAPVFEQAGRKAVLTPLGKVLYSKAESLLNHANALENLANAHARGLAVEISLAADALTPKELLLGALEDFSKQCPQTRIRVLETTLSGTDEALLSGQVSLALSGRTPPGFLGQQVFRVQMVAVASCHHPLAILNKSHGLIHQSDLKQARQIVIRDSGQKRQQDSGWLQADQRWTFSHFSTSIDALRRGLGFAFIPLHLAKPWIDQGELVRLQLDQGGEREIPLYLVQSAPEYAGPAVTLLAESIIKQAKMHR